MKPVKRLKDLKFKINAFSQQPSPITSYTHELIRRSTILNDPSILALTQSSFSDADYAAVELNISNIETQNPSNEKENSYEGASACKYPIAYLPDIVLGQIMSYLHWKEKEWFLAAFPSIAHVVDNSLAWEHFDNDRTYAVNKLMMFIYLSNMVEHEIGIIERYGRWFKSCTISLYNIPRNPDIESGGNDLNLLKAIRDNCVNLRSLHVKHSYGIDSSHIICDDYMIPIHRILDRRDGDVSLLLSRLFYKSTETVESGIQAYLIKLQQINMLASIVSLDCSHGLLFDGNIQVLHELQLCERLQTLKCPVECLNTDVVKSLYMHRLKALYLVNDEHTYEMELSEHQSIDWKLIYTSISLKGLKSHLLKVHYIFRNRALDTASNHAVPNPFVTSLVFDNLTTCISSQFLLSISDMYGPSVENIALCSNFWEFLMQFSDLNIIDDTFREMASKCIRMKSFLSCLHIPSSALEVLAETSKSLTTIRVFKEKTQLSQRHSTEEEFTNSIAEALNSPGWEMLSRGSNIFELPSVDNNLLFASCFNEI